MKIAENAETSTGVTFGGPGGRKALWAQRGIEKAWFSLDSVRNSKNFALETYAIYIVGSKHVTFINGFISCLYKNQW